MRHGSGAVSSRGWGGAAAPGPGGGVSPRRGSPRCWRALGCRGAAAAGREGGQRSGTRRVAHVEVRRLRRRVAAEAGEIAVAEVVRLPAPPTLRFQGVRCCAVDLAVVLWSGLSGGTHHDEEEVRPEVPLRHAGGAGLQEREGEQGGGNGHCAVDPQEARRAAGVGARVGRRRRDRASRLHSHFCARSVIDAIERESSSGAGPDRRDVTCKQHRRAQPAGRRAVPPPKWRPHVAQSGIFPRQQWPGLGAGC